MFTFASFQSYILRNVDLLLLITYMFIAINLIVITRLEKQRYPSNYSALYRHLLNRQELYNVISEFEERKNTNQHARREMDETNTTDNIQSMNYIITNNTAHLDIQMYETRLKQGTSVKLDFIPMVPDFTTFDTIPFISDNITSLFLTLPKIDYTQKVAILTLVRDVENRILNYIQAINGLTYPHRLMSLFLGEDSSSDGTFEAAENATIQIKTTHGFNDSETFHLNISGGFRGNGGYMHRSSSQLDRRAHMAKARNHLLKASLRKGHFDYILWIDSDVKTLPHDLVQQMIFAGSDVTVASCVYMGGTLKRNYDKNSWRETSVNKVSVNYLG